MAFAAILTAQEATTPTAEKPQVKINYINVCDPSAAERKELAAALTRIPSKTSLAGDFEVARGRTTITPETMAMAAAALPGAQVNSGENAISHWVRLRRDFAGGAFATAQYSVSYDEKGTAESFIFRIRDFKKDDIVQIALEDTVTSGDPSQIVSGDTPVDHIKVERFGKGSLGLRRCGNMDQSTLEPLFQSANEITHRYRSALGVKNTAPGELRRLGPMTSPKSAGRPKKKAPQAPAESKPAPAQSN